MRFCLERTEVGEGEGGTRNQRRDRGQQGAGAPGWGGPHELWSPCLREDRGCPLSSDPEGAGKESLPHSLPGWLADLIPQQPVKGSGDMGPSRTEKEWV